MTRPARLCVSAALLAAVACSSSSTSIFPDTITFGPQALTKGTSWTRQGMTGAVYIGPGEKMPSAALQVGAIVSTDHLTAASLHKWIGDQIAKTNTHHFHDSNQADESCRVAKTPTRLYLALEVCKTGVGRAICVEADEVLTDREFGPCISNSRCFQDLCDARSRVRREALDELAAELLTKR